MQYEWDETKRKSNLTTHGVDFAIASDFEWGLSLTIQDDRKDYSETRYVSLAPIADRLYVLAWTLRGRKTRIISLRKANRREVRYYEAET